MDIQEHTHRFITALHALEQKGEQALAQMVDLFAPQARVSNSALSLAQEERRGREAVQAFWADYCKALRDASTTFHAVTTSEREAGLFWTTRGRDFDYEGASLLAFDERGRIESFRGYYDTRKLGPAGAGRQVH